MRVFILGAGASYHAGYPLASGLGPGLADWIIKSCPVDSRPRRAIDRLHAAYGVLDDFERVITEVESSPLRSVKVEDRDALLGALRNALGEYFKQIRQKPAELYRNFAARCVQDQDLIISFNYDLALERELKRAGKWEARDGYGFDIGNDQIQTSPVIVLKPHGSTNWLGSFGGSGGFRLLTSPIGRRPFLDPQDSEFLGYSTLAIDSGLRGAASFLI